METRDLSNIPESKNHNYLCPNCHSGVPEEPYEQNGKEYPLRFNERRGETANGSYWDWDEVHYCTVCKGEFRFENGAT